MNKTIITRRSPLTGKVNRMEIPLTPNEYGKRVALWQTGMYIQEAFPTLTPVEREFVKTGITAEEWENVFGEGNSMFSKNRKGGNI